MTFTSPAGSAAETSAPVARFLDRRTPPHIATLILLAGLSALSMNIFLPSLPAMTIYFDADYRLVQLSVALYLGMNAVLQIFIGPISDRYGRRPVILWAIVIFLGATLGCIWAPTIGIFLAFRMVQAVVVAGMVLSRAVVRDMVSQDQAASMIGWVTMGMAVVPMIGPLFGGILDEWFGWQSNFWLLFILGCALFWLILRDLGETAVTRSVGLAAQFAEYPELLTSRRFWGYVACALFASGVFFAYLGGAPYVGTRVFGLSAAELGVWFGAPALGYMVGNGISGRYSQQAGINTMIVWGTFVTLAGMGLSLALHYGGLNIPPVFFGLMTTVGLGNGLVLPNATAGMLSVRPHLAGTASGLGGSIMIGGGALLSAFAGWVLAAGHDAAPLLWTMGATALCSVGSIAYVLRRERNLRIA